jgi:mannose-6-phosphate isomerase-like protein (cupin superfamily)
MKKVWIIGLLIGIIVAQWMFLSSFQSTLAVYHESGKCAVLASKLNYMSMRATITIYPRYTPDAEPVLVTFSNGSQLEITKKYSTQVFLPKSGSTNGDFHFSVFLNLMAKPEHEYVQMTLSNDNPIDVDVVPDVPDDFLSWYYEPRHPDLDVQDEVDVYWLIVEGNATVSISGYGAPF